MVSGTDLKFDELAVATVVNWSTFVFCPDILAVRSAFGMTLPPRTAHRHATANLSQRLLDST